MANVSETELKLQYFTGWIAIIAVVLVIMTLGSCMRGCNKDDNDYRLKAAEIKASRPAPVQENQAANVKITVEQK